MLGSGAVHSAPHQTGRVIRRKIITAAVSSNSRRIFLSTFKGLKP